MNKVFFIGDTHFGHERVLTFESKSRPFKSIFDHDKTLVDNWNAVVKKSDTVWHLGDVFFGKNGHEVLGFLNGYKKLILGNHDHHPLEIYQKHFAKIYGGFKYHDYILSHIPIHPSQFYRFVGNIHGHLHSNSLNDPRYINVSAEVLGLVPKTLEEILDKHNKSCYNISLT